MKPYGLWLSIISAATIVSACATTKTPDAAAISQLPVVELGQEAPEGKEYVLLLRSGQSVPMTVTVKGSMLAGEKTANMDVELLKDVYLYKQWSSLDGKTWNKKNISFLVGTGLDTKGGKVNITIDEIK
jgi:hypothetical protein